MNARNPYVVDSAFGKIETDCTGSPVGVVRMDPEKSYAGIGELLHEYIDRSNQEPSCWATNRRLTRASYEPSNRSPTSSSIPRRRRPR